MALMISTVAAFAQTVDLLPKMYLSAKNTPVGNTGWEVVDAGFNNANTDYWKMVKATSTVTSPEIDFSTYSQVVVKIGVGSFGAGTSTTTECNVKVEYYNGTAWSDVTTFAKPASSASNDLSVPLTADAAKGKIRFTTPNATGTVGARLFYVQVSGGKVSSGAYLTVNPTVDFGAVLTGATQMVSLNIKGANLTGDLTVSAIAPFATTVTTIAKDDAASANGYNLPLAFAPSAKGTYSGSLTVSGGGLTADVVVTLTGSGYDVKQVTDVTALRAEWTGTEDANSRYELTGASLVSFVNGKNIYVQDNLSGLLVYDKNGLVTAFNAQTGDKVSGLVGTLALYYGMLEFIVTDAALTIVSSGNEVNPVVVSAADFVTGFSAYEGRLVKINNLSIPSADGVAAFKATAESMDATVDGQSLVVRTFGARDYAATVIPNKTDMTGLAVKYATTSATTYQLSPRSVADIAQLATAAVQLTLSDNVFVQNGALVVIGQTNQLIEVYDVLGHLVESQKATAGRTEIRLPKGLYLVRTSTGSIKVVL